MIIDRNLVYRAKDELRSIESHLPEIEGRNGSNDFYSSTLPIARLGTPQAAIGSIDHPIIKGLPGLQRFVLALAERAYGIQSDGPPIMSFDFGVVGVSGQKQDYFHTDARTFGEATTISTGTQVNPSTRIMLPGIDNAGDYEGLACDEVPPHMLAEYATEGDPVSIPAKVLHSEKTLPIGTGKFSFFVTYEI